MDVHAKGDMHGKCVVNGKGVVVTGAGHGIGRAIATRMAAGGARVVVNDLDGQAAVAVAEDIGGHPAPGDAATEAGASALVDAAREHLGAIDIFFANAGIDLGAGLDTPTQDRARALEVNAMWSPVRSGMRKPNPRIFTHILDLLDVPPEQVVFVDEAEPNTDAASRLGILTVPHAHPDNPRKELARLISSLSTDEHMEENS